jgi:signal transduction histidine kinase
LLLTRLAGLPNQGQAGQPQYLQENILVNQLASGIAHYFNNILMAIIGFTDLSQNTLEADHAVQENLRVIKETAQQAADIVKRLLAFTQQQFIRPQPLNLNTLIEQEEATIRRWLARTLQVAISLAPDLGLTHIDPDQARQLLRELVNNAQEAMADGNGYLTIETANTSFAEIPADEAEDLPAGDYVMLVISDTGQGMTEAQQSRAFDPFYTTKQDQLRTGLGLSACFGIARQNGGFISISSEMGKGTTIRVYLPRIEEDQPTSTES